MNATEARTGLRTSAATGLNVRAVMARTGLSQTTLATALGLSQASVSARLRGVTPWSVDELVDTARVLDVHPHALLDVDA